MRSTQDQDDVPDVSAAGPPPAPDRLDRQDGSVYRRVLDLMAAEAVLAARKQRS